MAGQRFSFGDQVRHAKRPEWGVGSVVKTEDLPLNGQATQRVSVRFPGVGVKALNTAHAELQRVAVEPSGAAEGDGESHPVGIWDEVGESEWLAPVAQRKIEEAMISLPPASRDLFNGLRGRLEFTLRLYRFDRSGRGLIDWAVAQTGLDDPLSRFNRHVLEQYFDRWAFERDGHLRKLLDELDGDRAMLKELLDAAPPDARAAVKKLGRA